MLIPDLLALVEREFPSFTECEISNEEWAAILPTFCDEVFKFGQRFVYLPEFSGLKRLKSESKQEIIYNDKLGIVLAEFRLRPASSYYTSLGKAIPSPENPKGPHATGICFSITLCRGFKQRLGFRPPAIFVELDIWGAHERERFREMLIDHRYLIERLLMIPSLAFDTAVAMRHKKGTALSSAFKNLLDYYILDMDDECKFTLMGELGNTASDKEIIQVTQPLLALYDCALGYCLSKRPKNARRRLLQHLNLIGT